MTDNQSPDLIDTLKQSRLSVIVPVFNEAQNIKENLGLLIREVEPYFHEFEIWVISDGSTDGTDKVLKEFSHPRVQKIFLEKNRGKGHAVREGFKTARGDYILFIDGGMELHPKEIRIFLGLMTLYQADIVVGSKRHPQSDIDYPVYRRALSYCYQQMIRRLFDLDVTDTQVGIKLFRKEVIQAILPELTIDRYGFDLELLALAKKHGYGRVLEAPIRLDYFVESDRGLLDDLLHVSKVGSIVSRDTLKLYWRLRARRKSERE